jgi:hypothetical protein
MIIKLDWFGCEPKNLWENRIHQVLEKLTALKPITRASVRVEELRTSSPPFHLTLMLSMPGPDVLASGVGHTFDEALRKLEESATKSFARRKPKPYQPQAAIRGMKTLQAV